MVEIAKCNFNVSGRIVDNLGNAVPGADVEVLLEWAFNGEDSGLKDAKAVTDQEGDFLVNYTPPCGAEITYCRVNAKLGTDFGSQVVGNLPGKNWTDGFNLGTGDTALK